MLTVTKYSRQLLSRLGTTKRALGASHVEKRLPLVRSRIPTSRGSPLAYYKPSPTKFYCTHTFPAEEAPEVELTPEGNRRLEHKEAVELMEQNGLIKNANAFKIFLATDPGLFAFTSIEEVREAAGIEAPEDEESKLEEDELYMDNWLHSALTVVGVLSIFDETLKPGSKALDLGCGNGYMAVAMAQLVAPNGKVVAVDTSELKLEAAKRTVAEHFPSLMSVIEWRRKDAFDDHSENGAAKFDAIHVGGGVQEVPQAWLSLVRTGGSLVAATPEIEPTSKETQFMLRKYLIRPDGAVHPINLMFVQYEELKEPSL